MYGAILGDIIGSPYEFNQGNKTKEFPLFSEHSTFTDDTVMTLAVADALHDSSSFQNVRELNEDNIMPEAFNPKVAQVVADAVKAHIVR